MHSRFIEIISRVFSVRVTAHASFSRAPQRGKGSLVVVINSLRLLLSLFGFGVFCYGFSSMFTAGEGSQEERLDPPALLYQKEVDSFSLAMDAVVSAETIPKALELLDSAEANEAEQLRAFVRDTKRFDARLARINKWLIELSTLEPELAERRWAYGIADGPGEQIRYQFDGTQAEKIWGHDIPWVAQADLIYKPEHQEIVRRRAYHADCRFREFLKAVGLTVLGLYVALMVATAE